MKKILFLFAMVVFANLKSFCATYYESSCSFLIEGVEPDSKKYCFSINKPDEYDASKYQFMMWKVLKNRGYELVPASEADIVIQLNFVNKESVVEGHEIVGIGEKTTEAFGQTIQVPVYQQRSTGHYTDKSTTLVIKAFPKEVDRNSIPIWEMKMQSTHANIKDFIYGIDFVWLQEGPHNINYKMKFKNGEGSIIKIRQWNQKLTNQQAKTFEERMKYLDSKLDAAEYNQQLNR